MKPKNEPFHYTYSASQQEELKQILQKYIPPEEDKMEQLRRLDRKTSQLATLLSILTGTFGMLLFGIGMCCTTVWTNYYLPGIFAGVFGIAVIASAYPIKQTIAKRQRKKLSPKILALAGDLLDEPK